jgi:hypothetical protein
MKRGAPLATVGGLAGGASKEGGCDATVRGRVPRVAS